MKTPPKVKWRVGVASLLAAATLALPYLLGLGDPPLWDANESLYAQPPREVVQWPEGDFLSPTWNGRTYFAHPPLATWITVPFYALLGPSAFSGRLPMALAALLTIGAVWRLTWRLHGSHRAALLAAACLAATPRFWLYARQLAGDVYLVALLTWAFALALPALAGNHSRPSRPVRWGAVLAGVAVLAKGPVALVLYFGGLLVSHAFGGRPVPLARLHLWRALGLSLLVAIPWSAYMALRHPEFLAQHYGWFHLARLRGDLGDRGPFFYAIALLGDAQPLLFPALLVAILAFRRPPSFSARCPWLICLYVVLLFSLSGGKRNVYLLPLYPVLAVGLGAALHAWLDGARATSARLLAGGVLVATGCAAALLHRVGEGAPRLWPELGLPLLWLAGVGVGALVLLVLLPRTRMALSLSLVGVLGLETTVALAFPALSRYRPVPEMAAEIRRRENPAQPEPVFVYATSIHSLVFYLGRRTTVASDRRSLSEKMGPASSAFLLAPARVVDPIREDLPPKKRERREAVHLARRDSPFQTEVLLRRPLLAFRFDRTILGTGPSTEDLLLVRVTRRMEEAPPAGR